MFILCDTSSILMLLRIAPDMFTDERYQCKTICDIHNELVQTTKFKSKYPWIRNVRSNLKISVLSSNGKKQESLYFEAIRILNRQGIYNKEKKHLIDLSRRDMKLLSHALSFKYQISTGDDDLEYFARTQFTGEFEGNITPLEIINLWLRSDMLEWDDEKHKFIEKWVAFGEHQQPSKAIKEFQKITGYKYPK